MSKEIVFVEQSKILNYVQNFTNLVKSTFGPCGKSVLIQQSYGGPRFTKDGVSVAKAAGSADALEDLLFSVLKKAPDNENLRDGTTSATILTHELYRLALRSVSAGASAVEVSKGIEKAVAATVKKLQEEAMQIGSDFEKIKQVATIAANGDDVLGSLIADAIQKVGPKGAVTIESSKARETELEVVEGMEFDRGYLSQYLLTDQEKMMCVFDDPYVLLVEKKISAIQPLIPILEAVLREGRSLLIVAEDFDNEILTTFTLNRLRSGLKICPVKSPGYGDNRKHIMQDIAVLTGATVISEEVGLQLDKIDKTFMNYMGKAKRTVVRKDTTTIVAVATAAPDQGVADRCAQIEKQIEECKSDYDREKLEERLAKLSGGVAVVRIGGATEIEVSERKDRADDAYGATRAAVEGGILPGGGTALLHAASFAVKQLKAENEDQKIGFSVVEQAASCLLRVIAENAGKSGEVVLSKVLETSSAKGIRWGYDAKNDAYVDMVASGVIDALLIVSTALQNASSVARLLLTTSGIVLDKPEKEAARAPSHGMDGGY